MLFQIFSDNWTEGFTYLSALEVTTTAAAEASSATSRRHEQRSRKKAAVAGEIKSISVLLKSMTVLLARAFGSSCFIPCYFPFNLLG